MQPVTRRPPAGPLAGLSSVAVLALVALAGLVLGAAAVGLSLRAIPFSRSSSDTVRIEALAAESGSPAPATAATPRGAVPDAPVPLLSATDPKLEQVVRNALGVRVDHYSVVVKDLEHGTGVVVNEDREFYAASLFKLAVMYEAYRQAGAGQLALATEIVVTPEAMRENLGTLDKVPLKVGDRLSVARLIELMIVFSDNSSSVLLRDVLGRPRIDQTMRSLGLRTTSVSSPDLPTTAADMVILAEAIATGRGVGQAASREMTQMLRKQSVRGRIPAGLPPAVPVANKTGTWDNAGHDVAIVYAPSGTYLLVVLSDLTVRDDLIAELSRDVYTYYAGRVR